MAHPVVAVLDALLIEIGIAPALSGVQIFDGPPVAEIDHDAIAVGVSIDDATGATGTTRPGYGTDRTETFDITGFTQAWSGDVDIAARRARAFALLDALRSLLIADPSVGGTCQQAVMTRWAYRPVQGPAGSLAVVNFGIRVNARRFEG